MVKTNLRSEKELKAYLKKGKYGNSLHYQIYKTLSKYDEPMLSGEIIEDMKSRVPKLAGGLHPMSLSLIMKGIAWAEGDRSTQKRPRRQMTWRLKLSESFYEDEEEE